MRASNATGSGATQLGTVPENESSSRNYSLNYWCHVYGVVSPKGGLNGAEVAAAFERGDYDDIARYALGDALATGEVFRRLESTLLMTLEAPRE